LLAEGLYDVFKLVGIFDGGRNDLVDEKEDGEYAKKCHCDQEKIGNSGENHRQFWGSLCQERACDKKYQCYNEDVNKPEMPVDLPKCLLAHKNPF